jgi:hypothetical protein
MCTDCRNCLLNGLVPRGRSSGSMTFSDCLRSYKGCRHSAYRGYDRNVQGKQKYGKTKSTEEDVKFRSRQVMSRFGVVPPRDSMLHRVPWAASRTRSCHVKFGSCFPRCRVPSFHVTFCAPFQLKESSSWKVYLVGKCRCFGLCLLVQMQRHVSCL